MEDRNPGGRPAMADEDRAKIETLLREHMPVKEIEKETGKGKSAIYTIKRIMEAREQA